MNTERLEKGLYWDAAWKLVEGCTKVSPGCDNCWSETETAMRAGHPNEKIRDRAKVVVSEWADDPGFTVEFNGRIICREDNLDLPLRTRKPTVFSVWNDLFHEDVPGEFRANAFQMMERARKIGHTFLVLTKRAEAMANLLEDVGVESPDHIWWGVTAENQEQADARIPHLLRVPGKRFLSVEPMLGPIGMHWYGWQVSAWHRFGLKIQRDEKQIHAVLCGGESGKNARPMHPDWVRSVRDQCAAAGVPFFFKQWGEWTTDLTGHVGPQIPPNRVRWITEGGHVGEIGQGLFYGDAVLAYRLGKKAAGRTLDGCTHDDLPWGDK